MRVVLCPWLIRPTPTTPKKSTFLFIVLTPIHPSESPASPFLGVFRPPPSWFCLLCTSGFMLTWAQGINEAADFLAQNQCRQDRDHEGSFIYVEYRQLAFAGRDRTFCPSDIILLFPVETLRPGRSISIWSLGWVDASFHLFGWGRFLFYIRLGEPVHLPSRLLWQIGGVLKRIERPCSELCIYFPPCCQHEPICNPPNRGAPPWGSL